MRRSVLVLALIFTLIIGAYAYSNDSFHPRSGGDTIVTVGNEVGANQYQDVSVVGGGDSTSISEGGDATSTSQGGDASSKSDAASSSGASINTRSVSNYETRTPPLSVFPPYLPYWNHGGWGTVKGYFPNGPNGDDTVYERAFNPCDSRDMKELKGVLKSLSYDGPLESLGGVLNGVGAVFGGPDNFHRGRGFEIANSLIRDRRPGGKPLLVFIDSNVDKRICYFKSPATMDVIVPVETGYFALHGLSKQLETLSILCRRCSQHVNVRVLASMYDIRTKMAREILAELRDHFGDKMFKTIVRFNTKIKEASSFGQPISEYDPASKGQRDFYSLAQEILGSQARQQRHEFVNSLAGQLESISTSADELLQATKPPLKVGEPAFATANRTKALSPEDSEKRTSEKLSDYYGVSQVEDAIVFVTLYPRAEIVQIAGDFNNWQPENTPMKKVGENGVWQTEMKLPIGRYRYRLVVDGQWQQDPYNEATELNPFGELNSVIEIK